MDDIRQRRRAVRVAFVGPCGSGKSTLAQRLRDMGIDARMPAQEHSGVPAMWQKMLHPDWLFMLDAPNAVLRERRPGIDLNDAYLAEQRRRLAHAYAHADIVFDTSTQSEDEIISTVLARLREEGEDAPPSPD